MSLSGTYPHLWLTWLDHHSHKPQQQNMDLVADSDPFEHLSILGQGAFGWVDKVRRRSNPIEVYARKSIRLRLGFSVDDVKNEIRIMQRLRHTHIVQVVQYYDSGAMFCFIMSPVADTDLASYMMRLDAERDEATRVQLQSHMLRWPACLVATLDFVHEMRVKHKDLKPANILIKGFDVVIADFGIAMDMVDDTTTYLNGLPESHTPTYCSPEVLNGGQKTSRAADVFSLGCIFLEICTCLVGQQGALSQFQSFRQTNAGSPCYANSSLQILQWIWHLWALWGVSWQRRSEGLPSIDHGISIADLSFFMLDPNAKMRITCRQLCSIIDSWYYKQSLKVSACGHCIRAFESAKHLPLHSSFKDTDDVIYAKSPGAALRSKPAESWEEAKRKWLAHHMWW